MRQTANSWILIFIAILSSCGNSATYEEYKKLDNNIWHKDSVLTYDFDLPENADYNISLDIRHAYQYPFSNLYLKYQLAENGTKIDDALVNIDLFNRKTGKPLGNGLGDIFDYQVLILPKKPLKKGSKYQIRIHQFMRMEQLPMIMSLGVSVNLISETDSIK